MNVVEEKVRDALRAVAERQVPPPLDADALLERGRRRSRERGHRRLGVGAVVAVVVATVALAMTADVTPGSRQPSGVGSSPDPPSVTVTAVPYCTSTADGTDLLHLGTVVIEAKCAFRSQRTRLWHTAGTTIIARSGQVFHVGGRGEMVQIAQTRIDHEDIHISDNGRWVAWLGCPLEIYDAWAGTHAVTTRPPEVWLPCAHLDLAGITNEGRAYFSGTTAPDEVSYYDLESDTWAPVRGLPEGSGGIAYVTGDVIALFESAQQGPTDAAARSIEGRVSPEGIFSDPRTVERGRTVWSSDGTELVQQRPGGLVLQEAVGLRRTVPLAVPESLLTGPAMWDVQWEGSGSLLLSLFTETEPQAHVFRCSSASGHCVAAPELGSVAASNNTSPGG